jgi:6-pyruvoyl-tetrahydropterin synthase
MDASLESGLANFFKQFGDFSDRAKEHWPLSGQPKAKDPASGIGYAFTVVSQRPDILKNTALVDHFFDFCKEKKNLFSGREQTALPKVRIILDEQVSGEKTRPEIFLIIGHAAADNEARIGCIGWYFPESKTILIESIWINSETETLKKDIKQFNGSTVETTNEKDRQSVVQTVLGWMLSYPIVEKGGGKKAGLRIFIEDILCEQVNGVFHEAANPSFQPTDQILNAADALRCFHAIDAGYLKFSYRHPHYKPGEKSLRSVLLLTFPQFTAGFDGLRIEVLTVMKFVLDYCKFLNAGYEHYREDLIKLGQSSFRLKQDLRGFDGAVDEDPIRSNKKALLECIKGQKTEDKLYLHRIPRSEEPRFNFRRASVGFEIVVDEDYFKPEGLPEDHISHHSGRNLTTLGQFFDVIQKEWSALRDGRPDPLYCEVAHSGETDLFAYKYQDDPPYFTKYFRSANVDVTFPSSFEFTSEGRFENFYRLPNVEQQKLIEESEDVFPKFSYTVGMIASVSYTYFRNSSVRVWHLVLRPQEAEPVSELELIKLMRFFSGSQEFQSEEDRRIAMEAIKFSVDKKGEGSARESSFFDSSIWRIVNTLSEVVFDSKFYVDRGYSRRQRMVQAITWGVKSWLPGFFTIIVSLCCYGIYVSKEDFIEKFYPAWQNPAIIVYWTVSVLMILSVFAWSVMIVKRLTKLVAEKMSRLTDRVIYSEPPKIEEEAGLIRLLEDLTCVSYQKRENGQLEKQNSIYRSISLRNVTSGVVEIDTGSLLPEDLLEGFDRQNYLGFYPNIDPKAPKLTPAVQNEIRKKIKDMYKDLYDGEISVDDNPDALVDDYAEYVFKSYCGICLGIFDYDRMGFQEIDDTLVPLPDSKTESSFLAVHRGVLAMIGSDDDVMDTYWDTIGANLYLLIPSAVLAHNDKVARDAEGRLDTLLSDLRSGASVLSIRQLNEQRNQVDDLLNDDILGNVFQYKTEQELYNHGMARRGIDERIGDSRAKLEQLEKLIQIKQEESTSRYQRRITTLATVVGIFSFYSVIHDFFVNELAKGEEAESSKFIELTRINDTVRKIIDQLDENLLIVNFKKEQGYDPLALAHFSIGLLFLGLIGFLIISILVHPDKNKRFFWQRNSKRLNKLSNTHASSSKNRSYPRR